jgi:DNA-binding transcriptional MerR regulator
MKELFTIGEVAKLFNVKVTTLRYYDEIGLLKPEFIHEQTKYRYYSTQQFERLGSIKYLRALDVSIEDLLNFFDYKEINYFVDMLKRQQQIIYDKEKTLKDISLKIQRRLNQIEAAVNEDTDVIKEVYLEKRQMIYIRHEYIVGDDIEYPIAELRNIYGVDQNIFLGKIGLSMSKEKLLNQEFDTYDRVYMILEAEDILEVSGIEIPCSHYIQIRFKGTHKEAKKYYKKLLDYIKEKQYTLNGYSQEMTLIDYGITNNEAHYITEILLPINKNT